MRTYTKISLGLLLAAIVAGLIMLIPASGGGFLNISPGFVIGYHAELFLIPCGIIFSLIALIMEKKEKKYIPGISLLIFLSPIVVILGEPYFEEIEKIYNKREREKQEIRDKIISDACKIMAGKTPLWLIGELDDGYPVYLLDIALVNYNYNDTIEVDIKNGEYLFQLEELYVHATHNKIAKTNKEIPYSICKKRVSFTPVKDINDRVTTVSIEQYDMSGTNYLYKNKICTKIEDTNRKYKIPKDGHPYDVGIYMNFFMYYARHRIEDSDIAVIYEDTDSLTSSNP